MKYPSGRNVSPTVFQAVRYAAKVGVITRRTWYELFANGTDRWKRKQLRLLLNAEVFVRHPYDEVKDAFVLGKLGLDMIESMKWKAVHLLQPKYIRHDETVAKGLLELERLNLCQKWMTESELKSQRSSNFKLHGMEGGAKYPDAVLKIDGKSLTNIVALEYERTSKSSWRYNKAIKAYSDSSDFSLIIFIIETLAIESLIKRSMSFVADQSLNARIGFIKAEDWKRNPAQAPIRGSFKSMTISDLSRSI